MGNPQNNIGNYLGPYSTGRSGECHALVSGFGWSDWGFMAPNDVEGELLDRRDEALNPIPFFATGLSRMPASKP